MKRVLPILLLAALGFGGWWWYDSYANGQAEYSGTIEAEDAQLGSKVGGRVIAVEVKEGDPVRPGEVLVRLDRERLEAQRRQLQAERDAARQRLLQLERGSRAQEIAQAQAALAEAQARLRLMKKGPRTEEIRAARENVQAAQAQVELARTTRERMQKLRQSGDISQERLDQAVTEQDVAINRLEAAQAELEQLETGYRQEDIAAAQANVNARQAALDLVQEGPRAEEIEQARAQLQLAEATVQQASIDLQETIITAPSAGVIETSRLQPGDLLAPNQTAITMILYEPLWVRVYAPESELGKARIGREVRLSVNSYPEQTFIGRIVQVNREAEYTPRNVQTPENRNDLVFGVKIEIEDPEQRLRPGMIADVKLEAESN
jgi:multidrug resistance efflux pump